MSLSNTSTGEVGNVFVTVTTPKPAPKPQPKPKRIF